MFAIVVSKLVVLQEHASSNAIVCLKVGSVW
jgi:hypothetical protein